MVDPLLMTSLLDPRLHAVLANPLRHEIVLRTSARPWSPTELADATGCSLDHVSKACRELKKENLIELVVTKTGPKGGTVYLYRAARFMVHAEEWERLSEVEQATSTGQIVMGLKMDMDEALAAGTLYAHPHHALIRDHRMVDDQGMKRCAEALERAYEEILEAERESVERCGVAPGRQPFPIGLGLSVYPRAPEGSAE